MNNTDAFIIGFVLGAFSMWLMWVWSFHFSRRIAKSVGKAFDELRKELADDER